jgi:hypothetical protein
MNKGRLFPAEMGRSVGIANSIALEDSGSDPWWRRYKLFPSRLDLEFSQRRIQLVEIIFPWLKKPVVVLNTHIFETEIKNRINI